MRLATIIAVMIGLECCSFLPAAIAGDRDFTVRLNLQGRTLEGTVLRASNDRVSLLARDGYWWNFRAQEPSDFRRVGDGFRSYSPGELRGQLLQEFGAGFEVSGTGHYLVVHRSKQGAEWATRFEDLYRGFVHYFTARGMAPKAPEFPLVAVVFANQDDFQRYAHHEGVSLGAGVLGYYSPTSNRVAMFDVGSGKSAADWLGNAEVIIHEATHQSAFNSGIHNRFTATPRWLAEGLGTMFESRGVWDSLRNTKQADRINRGRLESFRKFASTRRSKGTLLELVAHDRLFRVDPEGAYAESWAFSFFVAETEPRKYQQYLLKTAAQPAFSERTEKQRLDDFSAVFGNDLVMLETRFLRYLAELRSEK